MSTPLPLFVDSYVCRDGIACRGCRDPVKAPKLRAAWERRFTPPPGWACPKGLPMSDAPAPPAPPGTAAAGRRWVVRCCGDFGNRAAVAAGDVLSVADPLRPDLSAFGRPLPGQTPGTAAATRTPPVTVPFVPRMGANGTAPLTPTVSDRWTATGPRMWAELRAWAESYDAAAAAGGGGDDVRATRWLKRFRSRIGCGECGRHWDQMMKRTPPPLWGRPGRMAAWASNRHNEVSERINRENGARSYEPRAKAVWGLVVWRASACPSPETSAGCRGGRCG